MQNDALIMDNEGKVQTREEANAPEVVVEEVVEETPKPKAKKKAATKKTKK